MRSSQFYLYPKVSLQEFVTTGPLFSSWRIGSRCFREKAFEKDGIHGSLQNFEIEPRSVHARYGKSRSGWYRAVSPIPKVFVVQNLTEKLPYKILIFHGWQTLIEKRFRLLFYQFTKKKFGFCNLLFERSNCECFIQYLRTHWRSRILGKMPLSIVWSSPECFFYLSRRYWTLRGTVSS